MDSATLDRFAVITWGCPSTLQFRIWLRLGRVVNRFAVNRGMRTFQTAHGIVGPTDTTRQFSALRDKTDREALYWICPKKIR
jgi:hypothetical protein